MSPSGIQLLINPLHPHNSLDMMRMRKHINRSDVGDSVFSIWRYQREISDKSCRIAADIDDLSWVKITEDTGSIWMHSCSRRIDHYYIHLSSGSKFRVKSSKLRIFYIFTHLIIWSSSYLVICRYSFILLFTLCALRYSCFPLF